MGPLAIIGLVFIILGVLSPVLGMIFGAFLGKEDKDGDLVTGGGCLGCMATIVLFFVGAFLLILGLIAKS